MQPAPTPKPVHVDEVLHGVAITELSKRGDGIVRKQGLVIFVPGTKVGDRANIIIKRVGMNSAEGEVLE